MFLNCRKKEKQLTWDWTAKLKSENFLFALTFNGKTWEIQLAQNTQKHEQLQLALQVFPFFLMSFFIVCNTNGLGVFSLRQSLRLGIKRDFSCVSIWYQVLKRSILKCKFDLPWNEYQPLFDEVENQNKWNKKFELDKLLQMFTETIKWLWTCKSSLKVFSFELDRSKTTVCASENEVSSAVLKTAGH